MSNPSDILLEDLDTLPFMLLRDRATPAGLKDLGGLLEHEAEILKKRQEVFHALMANKFGERATAELTHEGKDTGTVYIAASNNLRLKVEVSKTVKWDQPKLRKALDGMDKADALHFGKIKLEVEERKFAAAPPKHRAALAPARTVVPGKPKFTFVDAIEDEMQEAA